MKTVVFVAALIFLSGCPCSPPQAVESHKELDTRIATELSALPNLPKIEFRTEFKRKTDEIFKTTPGVDALDLMLYRVCELAHRHSDTITAEQEFEMQREAYNTWLTYVAGIEKVAVEKVKAGLPGQPFGPPKIVASANVPEDTQARVRGALEWILEARNHEPER